MSVGFVPNNIKFRIVSSQAIATFKNDQAVDFHAIVVDASIDAMAREAMLLLYDRMFSFILCFERQCLAHGEMKSMELLSQSLVSHVADGCLEIDEVMQNNQDHFDRRIQCVVRELQEIFVEALKLLIALDKWDADVPMTVFPRFVSFISNYLLLAQNSLMCVEKLTKGGDAELQMTNWSKDLLEEALKIPVRERLLMKILEIFPSSNISFAEPKSVTDPAAS